MTHAIRKGIGILRTQKTSLFLCDMQEKFKPNIKYFNEIVANSSRVLKAASVMEIPIIATEQYPKGLGPTVPELGLAEANFDHEGIESKFEIHVAGDTCRSPSGQYYQ